MVAGRGGHPEIVDLVWTHREKREKRPFRTAVLLKICISRHDQQHGPGERGGDILTLSEPSCRFLIQPVLGQHYVVLALP